ncbi:hypothetical protein [Hominifimenecus sp. rT4P-3]|uniref:hypothetical protein n=1 Tax=Hominifimenecus sp. rT4P-3 TaxID=3242979 RepID=UPI003DA46620
MKKSWWKVPLYCMAASFLCYVLTVRILGQFTLTTLPDGTITVDNTRWMILSSLLFLAVIVVGGIFVFSKMTRKELFYSASVLVAANALFGLISYKEQGMFAVYWSILSEWNGFVADLLARINLNLWVSAVIIWALPYLFILFGKKDVQK